MKNLSRIRIQFNWINDKSFPLKSRVEALTSAHLSANEHHLDIGIDSTGNYDLQNMHHFKLMNLISEAIPLSGFSNCYFSFLHPLTASERSPKRVFSRPSPSGQLSTGMIDLIRSDHRYPQYNKLFLLMLKIAGTGPLSVRSGVEFNDKEEWGLPEDEVRLVLEIE